MNHSYILFQCSKNSKPIGFWDKKTKQIKLTTQLQKKREKGLENTYVDGFQKPIRWPNSRVQMRDQEAAVQQTSHSWLNLALTSLYYVHSCAKQRPDSCPPEVKPQATPHENHL